MDDLLPCPFCGASALMFAGVFHYVSCSNPGCHIHPETRTDNPDEAVERWNYRADTLEARPGDV